MSGPRQVRRIKHKAERMAQRDGYGQRALKRARHTDLSGMNQCGKIRHVTVASALAQIASLSDSTAAAGLNWYDCSVCGYLHVGHKS